MEEKARRVFGIAEALAFIGALAMLVSVFLFWQKDALIGLVQGIYVGAEGVLLFIVAALCFGAFAARSRGTLPSLAFVGLGLAGLAVIGNFTYGFFSAHVELSNIREGFYVAGVGSLLVLVGGISKMLARR